MEHFNAILTIDPGGLIVLDDTILNFLELIEFGYNFIVLFTLYFILPDFSPFLFKLLLIMHAFFSYLLVLVFDKLAIFFKDPLLLLQYWYSMF